MSNTQTPVLAPNATLEKRAEGFQFTEGPIYDTKSDVLFFSDIPQNRMYRFAPKTGQVDIFRDPSGEANGNTLDNENRLITCEHGNRRVSRTEKDNTVIALAERYNGKRLNAPNDIIVRRDGVIFFTDPHFEADKSGLELGFFGVYRLDTNGALTLLVDDFSGPNGLAFSPDEKVLYIDDSHRMHIRAFDVDANSLLQNGRVFAETPGSGRDGVPDGMKVDAEGRVYCTSAGGVWVFNPDGAFVTKIETPEICANIAFGDHDNQTLYITATTGLYSIRLSVPGATRPGAALLG